MKNRSILALLCLPLSAFAEPQHLAPVSQINSGDTAWLLTASVLVLFMTIPGLALFYGGMVRKKNLLSTMMHCFAATALISVLWVLFGYSLAFTDGGALNAFIGGIDRLFLSGITFDAHSGQTSMLSADSTVPESVFMVFQMTFAIIGAAIIAGAFAERMKFNAFLCFLAGWFTLIYVPTAHWVWGGGFMSHSGVMDFAGGTVVHINAGVAGLVASLMIGKRVGYGREAMPPHNMAFTLIGAAMLWIGWFGFNAGSAGGANAQAGMAFAVTQVSASFGALTWILCERFATHKPSTLGLASGAVAGLVGITPAAGFVNIPGAMAIGVLTAMACYFAVVKLKHKLGYDDSLDAFGIHGLGGVVGSLLTGLFFDNQIIGADLKVSSQFWIQLEDSLIAIVYSALVSYLLLVIIRKACGGLRVERDVEREGLDINLHGERIE